ncbi:hypothetical protein NP493_172g02043 [Ridgeia piscesae]|uniref:Uncharacterized protein n=1 Tax=Ridgeia piscesae TaxID=27915 RepID=A0AAD9P335_RIDPI|nr:hypothetical protein NP493_172g02043 [Ridgeia piscesae]
MCTTSPEPDAILARAIISTLVRKGVRVLALDFDKTIVSVHTKGYWRQTTPKLAEYVRPCFRALLEAAISECDIYVSVVTYSMQPQLIRDVLLRVLPHSDISRVVIRTNAEDWAQKQVTFLGKQQHIAWLVTELFNRDHVMIQAHEILLLDDDIKNVQLAEEFGHQAYEVPEDVTLDLISEFVNDMNVVERLPATPTE